MSYTFPWIVGDDRRLTIADLRSLVTRARSVIVESDPYAADPDAHGELIAELEAVASLCDDAAMTSGELTLPAK